MQPLTIEKKYTGITYTIRDMPEAMLDEIIDALLERDYHRGRRSNGTTLEILRAAKNK